MMLRVAVLVFGACAMMCTAQTIDVTDFDATNPGPEMPLTDGGQPGSGTPLAITGAGDTMAGWTWYTVDSAGGGRDLTIPFGAGTAIVGEQVIRDGSGVEIDSGAPTSFFNLRWGVAGTAIALRKTYTGLSAGSVTVDWSDDTQGGLYAYHSTDSGATWTPFNDSVPFVTAAGTLDILFVANDGVDSAAGVNKGLQDVTLSLYTGVALLPNPASLSFGAVTVGGSSTRTTDLNGVNLDGADVVVGNPAGNGDFQIRMQGDATWLDSITYEQGVDPEYAAGALSAIIEVRFAPTALGSRDSTLPCSGGGAPATNVTLTGVALDYEQVATECLETLMQHGTDRYGAQHTPLLVSILDVNTLDCPQNPLAYDEAWRVARRERRNPAGANLLSDQPTLQAMYLLSGITGDPSYSNFATNYIGYYLENLVDADDFIWWGWHRHYDVYQETMTGHLSNWHEIHSMHEILWEELWQVNSVAVTKEIEAIWALHVVNKTTGETNRHGNGAVGLAFSMSAGAHLEAFAFMYGKTGDSTWLDRARLLANYHWNLRNTTTDLIAAAANEGSRWDGSHFTTAECGLHAVSLLRAFQYTGDSLFKDHALAYLRAYADYGYDASSGKFWGTLTLQGDPVPLPWATSFFFLGSGLKIQDVLDVAAAWL